VRLQRMKHFFSKAFVMPGVLFPSSWTPTLDVARRSVEGHPQTALVPRPEYVQEAAALELALRTAVPIFNEATEEGLQFRIYRLGSLEVRTTQERGGKEIIGAVFSLSAPDSPWNRGTGLNVAATAKLTRATEYVQRACADLQWGKYGFYRRYFLVLEIEEGHRVVTEQAGDGTLTWEENPEHLEDRTSLAKALRAADCAQGVSVADFKSFQANLQLRAELGATTLSMRKRYARAAYSYAFGADSGNVRAPWFHAGHGSSRKGKQDASLKTKASRPPSFTCLSAPQAI